MNFWLFKHFCTFFSQTSYQILLQSQLTQTSSNTDMFSTQALIFQSPVSVVETKLEKKIFLGLKLYKQKNIYTHYFFERVKGSYQLLTDHKHR